MSMSTHLANRVRHMLADRNDWHRFPDDVSEWLEVQSERSVLPEPHQLLVETFPHEGQHYMVAYSFEGWNAHQSLGMLITRRMENARAEAAGLRRQRLWLACYGLEPIPTPKRCSRPTSSSRNSSTGSRARYLLKTAFREVAVIGGLVERHHPGKRKTGRRSASRPTSSTTCCAATSPSICCCAPPGTTPRRMTELGRLVRLVDRARRPCSMSSRPDHADGGAGCG
jgi:ATP-dependent Lhr-like helicase